MKKTVALALAVAMVLTLSVGVVVAKPGDCTTLQDGTLVDSNDNQLVLGYDEFGYNYQGHIFNGRYCDYDRVSGGEYCDVHLIMKWNDAWLSNKDCDDDGKLDRYYGYDSYIGSGAWLTNEMRGTGEAADDWTYFCKIVAVPDDAELVDGMWYAADGTEIGPEIWGAFATILEVESGQGATYVSPAGPGFGNW